MTLVVLMGLGQRQGIAAALRDRGWAPTTPAAVVVGAATAAAWTWTGTLAGLGEVKLPTPVAGEPAPGMLVIGDVVTVAAEVEALRRGTGAGVTGGASAVDDAGAEAKSGRVR